MSGVACAADVRAVVVECLRRGVREFCVCPGARNSALLAAVGSISAPVSVFRFYDERSAAFFALGRMQATRRPVAVSMTSGTAVAEVLAAVIEAHYQGLPLVVLSADRPARYRGSGAPQAIEQAGLFAGYAEVRIDLGGRDETLARWGGWTGRRPAHVNICLEEPSAGEMTALAAEPIVEPVGEFEAGWAAGGEAVFRHFMGEPDDLIVLAGALDQRESEGVGRYLAALRAPVWAEAASGLWRFGGLDPFVLRGPERVFGRHRWKKVLRIGGVPSLRFWRDLEDRKEIEVCSVTAAGFSGLARKSHVVTAPEGRFFGGIGRPPAVTAVHENVFAEDARAAARMRALAEQFPRSEVAMLGALADAIPQEATVFLGNSLPVREWNLCGPRARDGRRYHANRGANGIDGALSTFLGAGAGDAEAWGIFGDLTTLYDLGAPWILSQLPAGRRRFVVVHNGGGKIFSRLPSLRGIRSGVREMIETPHATEFGAWAALWNMEYCRMDGVGLPGLGDAPTVIEVRPDPEESAAYWRGMDAIGGASLS